MSEARRKSRHEAERDRLWNALQALFRLVEDGTLVRDICHDGEPGFALRQIPLVKTLAECQCALHKIEPPDPLADQSYVDLEDRVREGWERTP